MTTREDRYVSIVLDKVAVCRTYQPKFGQGRAVNLERFRQLYAADSFYRWFGLDNPLLYAAHRAAGGITSLYRQIGLGCEILFRTILQDQLGLSDGEAMWSYSFKTPSGRKRTLSLDARIRRDAVVDAVAKQRVEEWMSVACASVGVAHGIARSLEGAVFEVRQGYKSKDAKRQNADVANAGNAYRHAYLPVVTMLSNQIDRDVAERYRQAGWLLLRGTLGGDAASSTYSFARQVLDYDLAAFFERNSDRLRDSVIDVLDTLLGATDAK